MNDIITSLVRTYVPVIVGSVIAWLAARGINVDEATSGAAVTALTGAIILAYYTIIRLLERKFPKIGVLLGSAKKPEYTEVK